MNLILFPSQDSSYHLLPDDFRTKHIRDVLKMSQGDKLYIGSENGYKGLAEIVRDDATGICIEAQWQTPPLPLASLELLIGLPRPQTARKCLNTLSSMGIGKIHFFQPQKGEASYAQSTLWTTDEWKRHLREGAEQAFVTTFPEVEHHASLKEALGSTLSEKMGLALDVYEATQPLSSVSVQSRGYLLAIGSESGWSTRERDLLRDHNFKLCSLGERILRTETAAVAGSTLLLSKLGVL